MNIPTLSQWQRGLAIAQQIAALEKELATILGRQPQAAPPAAKAAPAAKASPKAAPPAKRKLSPQALANIRAAQKRRWAKVKSGKKAPAAPKAPAAAQAKSAPPQKPEPAKAPEKKKRQLSPEVRAKLAAAMKARWEAARQSGGPAPTAKKEESATSPT